MIKKLLLIVYFVFLFIGFLFSQKPLEANCTVHLDEDYISDGQQYRALLSGEEVAEFQATFYEGNRYRIVACGARSNDNIVFNVYDKQRNLLFSNKDFDGTPYWDFRFESTIDCIIEASLNSSVQSSGIAMLLIGFKQ